MESKNQHTNIQKPETELQKKRKRKRGKQKRISEDVDNGSCVSNIVEVDAPDNANTVENIDLITDKWEIDENPRFDKNTNENTEYHEATTDTLHSQSSSQVETCEHLVSYSNNNDPPDYEHLKDENLSADIKNNIVVQNLVTDGIPSTCENPSTKVLHDGNKLSTQLSSESDTKLNRSISSTTKNLIQLYNPRALPKESETYELEKFDKNKLIIFNQIKFGQYERLGTEADLKSLKTTFEAFNFEVQDYPDPTVDKIEEILNEISVTDYSDYGCLAIAVLTHGGIDGKLFAADGDYYETKIINFLKTHKNHSLITKPRLLFVQVVRVFPRFITEELETSTNNDGGQSLFFFSVPPVLSCWIETLSSLFTYACSFHIHALSHTSFGYKWKNNLNSAHELYCFDFRRVVDRIHLLEYQFCNPGKYKAI
ncbi:hypothetical protein O3G_MSEX010435 [Manduca sexta]|uniref:Caspase family p20 domain-containing protein n=1 Tax=Manduca sexta TaxID=7130 RepID=A0A921ZIK2_MANSE|nr:hypothetical protein O3G_MSEX010435 [Manduca sexta]